MLEVKIDKIAYQTHKASGTLERYKSHLVGALIGQKYDINDQIGLLRQQYTKFEEYNAFNEFANDCVATVNGWFANMEIELSTHGA